jgi:hypothetical protein
MRELYCEKKRDFALQRAGHRALNRLTHLTQFSIHSKEGFHGTQQYRHEHADRSYPC